MEDVQQNKFLDSFTIPSKWNNQDSVNTWATHHGKIQGGAGGGMQVNGGFPVPFKGQRVYTLTQHKKDK